VALACRRWAAVMTRPDVWRIIRFENPIRSEGGQDNDIAPAGLHAVSWLARHCSHAEELHLQVCVNKAAMLLR